MKLSEVAPVDGIGYREVLEREALARKARDAAREAATKRTEELRRALAGHVAPDVSWAAEHILRVIEANPARFLDPKVLAEDKPKKPPANMQRTPGMIGNSRATIALHALAITRVARLIPPAEMPHLTSELVQSCETYYDRMKDDVPE